MIEAEKAFRLIEEKDVISWNTLIAACSHCDDHGKGLSIFKEMTNVISLWLDDFTYASALAACAGIAFVRHGKQIHAHLIRTKPDGDPGVDNALVNIIISGFGNHGHEAKALELFEQMKELGLKPDSVTFIALLTACNRAGIVDEGQAYFNSMNEIYVIAPDIEHFSCLIDLLRQAGRLKEAAEYIEKFPSRHDPVVLVSLLSAC
ncbi:pentatricopeptide repeat-containing protein At4g16470-like [Camellia sinensis]|uniref:pentatricopeptide repeat-containing protein At4g16470-like n=1 Tax=Camellia sinensis TaxID=4442 RepID=UPI001035F3AE|nr:pentatricopeptide repeat-containing protein At4g16470-like [Camellia sinensis]